METLRALHHSGKVMARLRLLLLHIAFFMSACKGQTRPLEIKEKKNSGNQYKDFAIVGERLWALTTDGKIVAFDAANGDPIPGTLVGDSAIIVLAKDKDDNIVIGDKSGAIKKFDRQTKVWTTLFKCENTLLAITFDSKNRCYLVTDKGIFDSSTKEYFQPDSSQNHAIRQGVGWFKTPAVLTDRNDNIWIGFGYGEWGGELFIFNTANRKFIVPNLKDFSIVHSPIKSIFESKEDVFVTSGLMHFSTSGRIAKFSNFQSSLVFESEEHKKFPNDSANAEVVGGEYIGPGAYNQMDNCIYFYSQNGIFKGDPKKDLTRIENWTKVLQPKLHWSSGQPDAVGSPMNVLKLTFISPERLVFVSQNDGLGIYDGKTLIMTR